MRPVLKWLSASVLSLAVFVGVLTSNNTILRPIQRSLASVLETILDHYQEPEASWAGDFNGGFMPATPVHDVEMSVVRGELPADLQGVYVRVGPNVAIWPPAKRTHVFDGDGMVHSVRFANGKAQYHASYIETARYVMEKEMGKEWFPRLGEFWGFAGLAKILLLFPLKARTMDVPPLESSTANTALGVTPNGKLWALNEGGLPYRLGLTADGAIESKGFDTLGGSLQLHVSAHPKYDYHTGETFFHGKDLATGTFHVGRIVGDELVEKVHLPIGKGFQHDMFITKDYVVVIDGSMRFDPKGVPKKLPLWNFEPDHPLSFWVFPRSSGKMTSDKFVKIEAGVAGEIVHTLFGYNEDSKIILWSPVGFHEEDRVDGILGGIGDLRMKRVVIDVVAQSVVIEEVDGGNLYNTEFGRSRDDCVGSTCRFAYSALQSGNGFNFTGLIKWDMNEKKMDSIIQYDKGVVGGEPVFIPSGEGDDDGYISMFHWNVDTQTSSFVLFDAKTMNPEPVCELGLDVKVPLGFHGWYVSEEQLTTIVNN